MRVEKAVQYEGYDGYLVTTDTSSFYPNGISVWEFGTDEDIKSKFNDDYKKEAIILMVLTQARRPFVLLRVEYGVIEKASPNLLKQNKKTAFGKAYAFLMPIILKCG